jgi:hypothetical protein
VLARGLPDGVCHTSIGWFIRKEGSLYNYGDIVAVSLRVIDSRDTTRPNFLPRATTVAVKAAKPGADQQDMRSFSFGSRKIRAFSFCARADWPGICLHHQD